MDMMAISRRWKRVYFALPGPAWRVDPSACMGFESFPLDGGIPSWCFRESLAPAGARLVELWDHKNDRSGPLLAKLAFKIELDSRPNPITLPYQRHAAARSGIRFMVWETAHGLALFGGFCNIPTPITAANAGSSCTGTGYEVCLGPNIVWLKVLISITHNVYGYHPLFFSNVLRIGLWGRTPWSVVIRSLLLLSSATLSEPALMYLLSVSLVSFRDNSGYEHSGISSTVLLRC